MRGAFPVIYASFAEFEQEELRKLDQLAASEEALLEEILRDDEPSGAHRCVGRPGSLRD